MPKVVLHFMRHSIKAKAAEGMTDHQVPLTPEGRELAAKKFEAPLDMRFAHVAGSSRLRTHETAVTAATQDPEANPTDLGLGKMRSKDGLDFVVDEESEYGKRIEEFFTTGRGMSFLVHESDSLAQESGDTTSSTYSRMAANIAQIIYRNFKAASRGASMLEQSEHPENELNDFERVLATHATIQESFLLKVVEKMKGETARDELLSIIGESGFGYTEGFDATLSKENGEEQIRITYKKGDYVFDEIVPASVIKEIAEEGN